MKKFAKSIALLAALVLMVSALAACSEYSLPSATTAANENAPAGELATGVYTVYNVTGEKVTELFLYENGTAKGENLAAGGMRVNTQKVLTFKASPAAVLTLEFTTESGTTAKFETLHIEEAPIAMLAVDSVSGATPISFSVPQDTGRYTFVNSTGAVVTELYVYPAGQDDKGENLAGSGMAPDASFEFTYEGAVDTTLVVEFTTETEAAKTFETLHIETATIRLLSVDGMTGATPISFN